MTEHVSVALDLNLQNTFADALPELHVAWKGAGVPAPEIVAANISLAAELSLDPKLLESPEGIEIVAGNVPPTGSHPTAMAYAGHQFGGYSPTLGDGRALLLGETVDGHGVRRDLHLKGSGRTPFARRGDGKAELAPMLREYVMAEAMHALNIPTTRALSVVATGELVRREAMVPGGVLLRVAGSHIRVGTFEYAARLEDQLVVQRLADYSIQRHFPDIDPADDGRYLAFLEAVINAQASLVAQWMLVGFIHGVLNTDNVTIASETIDYGPCAFMDRYDHATVFSSIDHQGRYAYGNQPSITQWNLARLAETLLPHISEDEDEAVTLATNALNGFSHVYEQRWMDGMATKLGLALPSEADKNLASEYLTLLGANHIDYTDSFRALAQDLRGDAHAFSALFTPSEIPDDWLAAWHERITDQGIAPGVVADTMDEHNPLYIPRNHLVDEALVAATAGDYAPFTRLVEVVTQPYVERDGQEHFVGPASAAFTEEFKTFCGT